MVEASYSGGYASQPMTRYLSYLPAQYWNFFNTRSATVDTAMQATVPNPFLAAVPAIQASNLRSPLLAGVVARTTAASRGRNRFWGLPVVGWNCGAGKLSAL